LVEFSGGDFSASDNTVAATELQNVSAKKFSGIPAGIFSHPTGFPGGSKYYFRKEETAFWSTAEDSANNAPDLSLFWTPYNPHADLALSHDIKEDKYSVRCIKD
jgi:uncharacterized protein (TIGR02145 family)